MNRDAIQAHIEALELLIDATRAIEDVEGVEFETGERRALKLTVADSKDRPVSFLHGLDPDLVLAGLRAIAHDVRQRAAQTQLEAA